MSKKPLINRTEVKVRFNEVDSMKVVWHGHYLEYFEDGRESFGAQYGVSYMDFFTQNILVPLVKIEVDFKKFLVCGERIIVETKHIDCLSAKLKFEYTVYRCSNNEIVATGKSIQVFLNPSNELLLTIPKFYYDWKKKWELI